MNRCQVGGMPLTWPTYKYMEDILSNLLELAIHAHGGLKLWREIEDVELKLSLTGVLLQIKGYPAGLPNITMKIVAHEQRMSISPYPHPGQIGHYTPKRVWIEDAAGISAQLENPLSSFAGYTLMTPWDQLQMLYFFGYSASGSASFNETDEQVRGSARVMA